MRLLKVAGYSLILMALTAPAVYADDPCLGDDEKNAALTRSAALEIAEKAGKSAAIFVAYMQIIVDDCMDRYDKNAVVRAKANIPKLGRDLAQAAETKGALYSSDARAVSQSVTPNSSLGSITNSQLLALLFRYIKLPSLSYCFCA